VSVFAIPKDGDPAAAVSARLGRRQRWLEQVAEGKAPVNEDPSRLQPVIRIYGEKASTVDLRSGLVRVVPGGSDYLFNDQHDFLLAALPAPREFFS
jgi:hypothetical protein